MIVLAANIADFQNNRRMVHWISDLRLPQFLQAVKEHNAALVENKEKSIH